MEIGICPHCGTRVMFGADQTCPSCRTPLAGGAAPRRAAEQAAFSDAGMDPRAAATPGPVNPYQSPEFYGDPHAASARPAGGGVLWILFLFSGRIPRRVYWGASIITTIMFYAAMFGLVAVFGEDSQATKRGTVTALRADDLDAPGDLHQAPGTIATNRAGGS